LRPVVSVKPRKQTIEMAVSMTSRSRGAAAALSIAQAGIMHFSLEQSHPDWLED
jgi:hypothetical protein